MFNSLMWCDGDLFQGLLTLCGMHDLDGKPILLCSCNDNSVRLYDLPSWASSPMFTIFLVLILGSWYSLSTYIKNSFLLIHITCVLFVIGSRRGAKYIRRKKLDQFKLVQAASSLPVTGLDKWKYGHGWPNKQWQQACNMLWAKQCNVIWSSPAWSDKFIPFFSGEGMVTSFVMYKLRESRLRMQFFIC